MRYHQQPAVARQALLSVFFCPACRSPMLSRTTDLRTDLMIPHQPGMVSDYAANEGNGFNDNSLNANGALIVADAAVQGSGLSQRLVRWRGFTTIQTIKDGTSNTFLVGEKHVREVDFGNGVGDSSVFNGDHAAPECPYSRQAGREWDNRLYLTYTATTPFVRDLPLAQSPTDSVNRDRRFGSYHTGICQFVMCDGSVRPISNSIDIFTLTWLAIRNDGRVVGDF